MNVMDGWKAGLGDDGVHSNLAGYKIMVALVGEGDWGSVEGEVEKYLDLTLKKLKQIINQT